MMTPVKPLHTANRETGLTTVGSICDEIRNHLERQRDQLCEEIGKYPPPIPACDVHFNLLLEERTRIFEELDRLHELSRKGRASTNLIDEFTLASRCLDAEAKRSIRAALQQALAGHPA